MLAPLFLTPEFDPCAKINGQCKHFSLPALKRVILCEYNLFQLAKD